MFRKDGAGTRFECTVSNELFCQVSLLTTVLGIYVLLDWCAEFSTRTTGEFSRYWDTLDHELKKVSHI